MLSRSSSIVSARGAPPLDSEPGFLLATTFFLVTRFAAGLAGLVALADAARPAETGMIFATLGFLVDGAGEASLEEVGERRADERAMGVLRDGYGRMADECQRIDFFRFSAEGLLRCSHALFSRIWMLSYAAISSFISGTGCLGTVLWIARCVRPLALRHYLLVALPLSRSGQRSGRTFVRVGFVPGPLKGPATLYRHGPRDR